MNSRKDPLHPLFSLFCCLPFRLPFNHLLSYWGRWNKAIRLSGKLYKKRRLRTLDWWATRGDKIESKINLSVPSDIFLPAHVRLWNYCYKIILFLKPRYKDRVQPLLQLCCWRALRYPRSSCIDVTREKTADIYNINNLIILFSHPLTETYWRQPPSR